MWNLSVKSWTGKIAHDNTEGVIVVSEIWGLRQCRRQLASAPGHPFYQRLNELLEAEHFDEFVEKRCAKFYAAKYGRPSLAPGIYFRALLIGYFEGIGAERGIAWRLADSLALRRFVGISLGEYTPDHSTDRKSVV